MCVSGFRSDIFYVRNHLPVPEVDADSYELEIEIEGSDKTAVLQLADIKALPKVNVTATIMCGGNRRSEMTEVKAVKGLSWSSAAVGNAVWSGPRLCDVLQHMGIESDEKRHVHVCIFSFCSHHSHHETYRFLFVVVVAVFSGFVLVSSRASIWIPCQRIMPPQYHCTKQWIHAATSY